MSAMISSKLWSTNALIISHPPVRGAECMQQTLDSKQVNSAYSKQTCTKQCDLINEQTQRSVGGVGKRK